MNDITILLYLLLFTIVLGMTFAFMYGMMKTTLNEFNKPRKNVHPEMEDVKSGDELLVFNMDNDDDDDDNLIIIRK
tara:strand:+ start:147 stop:374 length:228 start_codon:yes stop_codon:yes gene_type:complete